MSYDASEHVVVLPPGTKIEVTNDDIANGQCGCPRSCAVALAVDRLLPWNCFAYVTADWMKIVRRTGGTQQLVDLPFEVGQWISDWDEFAEYDSCRTDEDFEQFWEEHNDGEPYEILPSAPITFAIP